MRFKFTFVFLLFSVLFVRLFDLQVVHGKEWHAISEANRFFTKLVPASRGIIFDRFRKQLVYNKAQYFSLDNPQHIYSGRVPVSREEALHLMVENPEQIFKEEYRSYVYPESLSQVLGYVGKVSQEDLEQNQNLHLRQVIGKTGIERVFNQELMGQDGEEIYEMNAFGKIARIVSEKKPSAGKTLELSIDSELNQFIWEKMKGKRGAVVVGDPRTGEIYSLVSVPTYDPNQFTTPALKESEQVKKQQTLQQFFQDPLNVFLNRATAGAYPPGSTFKLITALAGLEKEAIDKDFIVVDEGVLKIGEFEFGNWYWRQYGRVEGAVNLEKAIARSNDIYFYKAAEKTTPDSLAEMARLFGLGEKTGIELASEARGLIPDPEWKKQTTGDRWYLGNTYHMGIGQGDLLVTPMQLFQMTTMFANHGKMCGPTLLKGVSNRCKELGLKDEHISLVRSGMIKACSAGGTAFPFFSWNEAHPDAQVACKTGTAEFGGEDAKGYRKTHGWFVAVVPISQITEVENFAHELVIVVLVESDESQPFQEGSRDAAPIGLEIVKWVEANR